MRSGRKRIFRKQRRVYKGKEYKIERKPTDREYDDMLFGWNVEQGITSNSVIYVKDGVTVGIGTGEQDRVGVAEIAIFKAYTKYADALCFRKYGIPYKTFELEAGQGKRDKGALKEIDDQTKKDKGGLDRVDHGFRRIFPVPGRGGCGHQGRDHGHRAAGRIGP